MTFKSTDSNSKVIHVKFNDEKAGKIAMQGDNIVCQNCWAPSKKMETASIKRIQFPTILPWACTVYKREGLGLDGGVIRFNL